MSVAGCIDHCAYVVLGAAIGVIVPLGESPDEIDHFRFIQALLFERALPVMQPTAADNVTMEANQPPLYYTLGAPSCCACAAKRLC